MKVGDRIRVKESIIVYHPESRNQPFDIMGLEGEVVGLLTNGEQTISANLPVYVQFSKKFRFTCVKLK